MNPAPPVTIAVGMQRKVSAASANTLRLDVGTPADLATAQGPDWAPT